MADETSGSANPGERGRTIATAAVLVVLVLAAGLVVAHARADRSNAFALGSGTAWFWSPSKGQAVQVNGSTARPVTTVDAQEPNEPRTIVQQSSGAIAVDVARSRITRIDAATWTATSPVPVGQGGDPQLRVVAGPSSLWAITQGGTLVRPLDPVSLAPLDSLTVPGPVTSAAVSDDDVLWTVNAVGEVRSFAHGQVRSESRVDGVRDARLVVARGRPVVVDTTAGAMVPLDEDGHPLDRICTELGTLRDASVAGATSKPWVLVVDKASATLTIADLDAGGCDQRFPLGAPGDDVDSPVERGDGLVFVAHHANGGEAVIIDPGKGDGDRKRLPLSLPSPDFVLFGHQGHVWFDSPNGEQMGVIRDDLRAKRVDKADPSTDTGPATTATNDGVPDTNPGQGPSTTVARTTVVDPGPGGRTTVTQAGPKGRNGGQGGNGGGGGGGGTGGGSAGGTGPPVLGVIASSGTGNRIDVSITTDGETWSAPRPQGTGVVTDAAFNGRQWIVTGYVDAANAADVRGLALTSNDGYTWAPREIGNNRLFGITWSEERGQWVAVGANGANQGVAATSPDGVTWTPRPNGLTRANLFDVAWSPQRGRYVAVGTGVGQDGPVATSPDGVTWTVNQSLGNPTLHAVEWSAPQGQFVAVGGSGGNLVVLRSPDGLTWQTANVGLGDAFSGVGYSVERNGWVAVGSSGNSGVLAVSTNGATWTPQTIGNIKFDVFASPVLYSQVRHAWYALGGFGDLPFLWTATREDSWTPKAVPVTGPAMAFAG